MARAFDFSLYGLLGLTLVSGTILANSFVSAEESAHVSNVDIAVPASCEMSGTGTLHSANVNNGTYQEDIGKTTLTVFCNDGGGYAIYAVGYTGEEIGGTNSTKLVGVDYALTIDTGVYTQGVTTASVWSMKLNKITDTSTSYTPANLTIENGFDSYSAVPASYTKVASFTSTTDLTLGSKLETTYAAYVSGTQRADTYNGKVKYTLVHPSSADAPNEPKACSPGNICYWPNGVNVIDSMDDQAVASNATEVTLWASNFQRQGYGFAGWSTTYNYSDPDGFLGPNEDINDVTALATIQSEGLSLYAYWVPSAGNLQGWNGCSGMSIGDVTALTDQRDNDTYAVAKLADSKCWIIENLRLDYTNSDNTTGSSAQGYGGDFAGLAQPETAANFSDNVTTANSLYYSGTQSGTASIDIGTTNTPKNRLPRYNNSNTNSPVSDMATTDANIYSYGNYYNWPAAKANTNRLDSENNSNAANTSLCPTGWKLPTGSGSGDFGILSNSLGGYQIDGVAKVMSTNTTPTSTTMIKVFKRFPNNFIYSGYTENGSTNNRGNRFRYWSTTSWVNGMVFTFSYLGPMSLNPGTSSTDNYTGNAIRCILAP